MISNLKYIRVQCGMTLDHLATDSGLTKSYLSKVERGISSPSIEAALKIASALGVTVEKLFDQQTEQESFSIVRGRSGTPGEADNYLSLVAGLLPSRIMRAFIVRPKATAQRGQIMSHHEGEEILFVLSGTIEMQVGKRIELLSKGDCVHFDSNKPHKLINVGPEPSSALVIVANKDN